MVPFKGPHGNFLGPPRSLLALLIANWDDFIAFDTSKKTPDESTMITWVKDSLGSTEVAAIEASLKAEIDLINTPVQATGVAF